MEIIKYSCYKYAPETARATVNGQPVNIAGTMIPQMIATGHKSEAEKALKRHTASRTPPKRSRDFALTAVSSLTRCEYITQQNKAAEWKQDL